ncbi:MAG: Flp pilus assembly complex ATPase component TadA [Deltaproteobacteria bacterium]|nr:Flp pilus assembly complex ATPase component TadA [Deltaproteobacteria bacterium]MBW2070225.1 Flp pilus assembly complex ATPase component TadA [Deltaproteobacteria bacterium]
MAVKKAGEHAHLHKAETSLTSRSVLHEISEEMHSAFSLNEIILYLKDRFLSLTQADRITVYVVDVAAKEIYSRFKVGHEISEIRLPISEGSVAGYVAKTGRIVNIKNAYDVGELRSIHPRLRFDRRWDAKTGYRTEQMLVVPIRFHRFTLGVLQLINKKDGTPFSAADEELAQKISGVLGDALYHQLKTSRRRPTKFDYLISRGLLTQEQLEDAIAKACSKGMNVEEILLSNYAISKHDLGTALSHFYRTRYIPFSSRHVIPGELLKNLKESYLRSNLWVPLEKKNGCITVLMDDPNHLLKRDMARNILRTNNIEFCVGLKEDILQYLDYFYGSNLAQTSIVDILGRLEVENEAEQEEEELVHETDNVVVQFVNKMIVDAYNRGASDIHLEPLPGRRSMQIRFRVDGVCTPYQTVPYGYKRAVVSRIKIMSDLDIAERRLPQDGKIRFGKLFGKKIELRVATMPTTSGLEDVVLRILTSGETRDLKDLGMTERNLELFRQIIQYPYGMILVVGPTGSGKTTTLHAAMAHINTPGKKIWTAEDPVEITQPGLRQVQVKPQIGLTFARAMRAFLRCDPDVIMVGEMRDEETAAMGIEASLTGHLVLTTLHTNSAPETITRLLDMGMDPFNFADALLGVLAQRLVRILCKHCREPYHPSKDDFRTLVLEYGIDDFRRLGVKYSSDLVLYRAVGCEKCNNTGYLGRTGIHELLTGSEKIKRMIQLRRPVGEIRLQARKEGMTTLKQDGIQKVLQGVTDLSEVRRVCMNK